MTDPAGSASSLTLTVGTLTGDPRVDDALARAGDLQGCSLVEQIPVYEDVHRRLNAALTEQAVAARQTPAGRETGG